MNYKSCAICHKAKTPICNHCTGFDKFEKALWAEDFESEIRADERAKTIDKVLEEVAFEKKWLFEAIREDKGNYNYNIDMAFSCLKSSLQKLKE